MNQNESRFYLTFSLLLTGVMVLATTDLILDHSGWGLHMAVEIAFDVLLLVTIIYVVRGWYQARRSITSLRETARRRLAERDEWRARAQQVLDGLSAAIDSQMRRWNLTDAERETAFFLLKGYSHKEIASLSGKAERTVRQHAVAVYRKSGLAGRAELSAFFLEDLLLPAAEKPADRGSAGGTMERLVHRRPADQDRKRI